MYFPITTIFFVNISFKKKKYFTRGRTVKGKHVIKNPPRLFQSSNSCLEAGVNMLGPVNNK